MSRHADDVRFFTIADDRFFPGFVGMVNSLRLAGHHEPVTVLDRGMSAAQRAEIRPHARVVSLDVEVRNPFQLKPFASQLGVEGVVVLIDGDMILLDRVDEVVRRARDGRICMFRDPDDARFFLEWSEIFDLRAPLRRQPYYNAGFVAFSTRVWPDLLDRWWEAMSTVWHLPSFKEGASMRGDPTSQMDQDALNALLMSEVPPDAVHELPAHQHVFRHELSRLEVDDLATLDAKWKGRDVLLAHCSGGLKPWTTAGLRTRQKAPGYLALLRRTLTGDDVAIQVDMRLLPPWLRKGPVGKLAFGLVEKWLNVRLVPPGWRRRLAGGRD